MTRGGRCGEGQHGGHQRQKVEPQENTDAAAKVLRDAGFEGSTALVGVSLRESVHVFVGAATAIGAVTGVIHAARVHNVAHEVLRGDLTERFNVWWCPREGACEAALRAPRARCRSALLRVP
ncbi:MAG: hypothetical protein U0326_09720 [Polyangiales bacterium]